MKLLYGGHCSDGLYARFQQAWDAQQMCGECNRRDGQMRRPICGYHSRILGDLLTELGQEHIATSKLRESLKDAALETKLQASMEWAKGKAS